MSDEKLPLTPTRKGVQGTEGVSGAGARSGGRAGGGSGGVYVPPHLRQQQAQQQQQLQQQQQQQQQPPRPPPQAQVQQKSIPLPTPPPPPPQVLPSYAPVSGESTAGPLSQAIFAAQNNNAGRGANNRFKDKATLKDSEAAEGFVERDRKPARRVELTPDEPPKPHHQRKQSGGFEPKDDAMERDHRKSSTMKETLDSKSFQKKAISLQPTSSRTESEGNQKRHSRAGPTGPPSLNAAILPDPNEFFANKSRSSGPAGATQTLKKEVDNAAGDPQPAIVPLAGSIYQVIAPTSPDGPAARPSIPFPRNPASQTINMRGSAEKRADIKGGRGYQQQRDRVKEHTKEDTTPPRPNPNPYQLPRKQRYQELKDINPATDNYAGKMSSMAKSGFIYASPRSGNGPLASASGRSNNIRSTGAVGSGSMKAGLTTNVSQDEADALSDDDDDDDNADVQSVISEISAISATLSVNSASVVGTSGRKVQLTQKHHKPGLDADENFRQAMEMYTQLLEGKSSTVQLPSTPSGDDNASVNSKTSFHSNATTNNRKNNPIMTMFFQFQDAAIKGHTEAQFYVAILLLQPIKGLFQNGSKGLRWLFSAAKGGHKEALHLLVQQLLAPPAPPVIQGVYNTPQGLNAFNCIDPNLVGTIAVEDMKKVCQKFVKKEKDDWISKFYLAKTAIQEINHAATAAQESKKRGTRPSVSDETLKELSIKAFHIFEEISTNIVQQATLISSSSSSSKGGMSTPRTPKTPGGHHGSTTTQSPFLSAASIVHFAETNLERMLFRNSFIQCCEITMKYADHYLPAMWKLAFLADSANQREKLLKDCAQQGIAEAYLHLALSAKTETYKLKNLIAAADAGVPEAWLRLRCGYMGDSSLLKLWGPEKLAMLKMIKDTPELRATLLRQRSHGLYGMGSPVTPSASPAGGSVPNSANRGSAGVVGESSSIDDESSPLKKLNHPHCAVCSLEVKEWSQQMEIAKYLDIRNTHLNAEWFRFSNQSSNTTTNSSSTDQTETSSKVQVNVTESAAVPVTPSPATTNTTTPAATTQNVQKKSTWADGDEDEDDEDDDFIKTTPGASVGPPSLTPLDKQKPVASPAKKAIKFRRDDDDEDEQDNPTTDSTKLGAGGEGQVISAIYDPSMGMDSSVSSNQTSSSSASSSSSGRNNVVKPKSVALKTLFSNDSEKVRDEMNKLMLFSFSDYIPRCLGHTVFTSPYPEELTKLLKRSQYSGYYDYDSDSDEEDSGAKKKKTKTFIVMELAPYGDLSELLHTLSYWIQEERSLSPLPLSLLIEWMLCIAKALQHMHNFQFKHLDVKPLNVLVFKSLALKVTDLGLTKLDRPSNSSNNTGKKAVEGSKGDRGKQQQQQRRSNNHDDDCTTMLTTDGTTNGYGTRGYAADDTVKTCASDIFSFGATCVHIINFKGHGAEWKTGVRRSTMLLRSNTALEHSNIAWCQEEDKAREALIRLIDDCMNNEMESRPKAMDCVVRLQKILKEQCKLRLSDQERYDLENKIRECKGLPPLPIPGVMSPQHGKDSSLLSSTMSPPPPPATEGTAVNSNDETGEGKNEESTSDRTTSSLMAAIEDEASSNK